MFQPAASHHSALAAAAAAMKAHEMPPGSYPHHPHPAAVGIGHHQLMDMYTGMTPATAINTMDWKNTSQVGKINKFLLYFIISFYATVMKKPQ